MDVEQEIISILSGYQTTCVLMTANELGLFDALADQPVSAKKVSSQLNLSLKGAERLLNALAAMGIAVKAQGHYQLQEEWKPFVTRDGERTMNQWIRLVSGHLETWTRLAEFVRTGEPLRSMMDMLGTDPNKMRTFIDAMHNKALKATWMIAREIPVGEATHLLDVGGGPGTYALEWCKLHPHLKATVFDIEPVTKVAETYIRQYGFQDRVSICAGDFNQGLPDGNYDLILLANVLHMYDETHAQRLVNKAAEALLPGGRLIINGLGTEAGQTGPLMDVMFDLNMGMNTEGGRAHPMPDLTQWLEEAGLGGIRHFRVEAMPPAVVTAIKSR
ncbi:MAG: methyltransferase domain-containing protein [Nitrospinaceae bacterium]|nr:methyltransferase domain-containing protein [Nitrospinaceae bacterium]NIR57265.1 methyltransferase domain-containing protein [Nitrospinaceae bacterium]NIS87713.1 methyltransferase domain-containing protein [Nitrospinaceae bacterium]NIT84579.1 methyltransferase domain-containing protein [Nitrospinaceae bacterium]NIU46765.1 methyltransferase domain-containing protein [Nitrospinaceae bacterium]